MNTDLSNSRISQFPVLRNRIVLFLKTRRKIKSEILTIALSEFLLNRSALMINSRFNEKKEAEELGRKRIIQNKSIIDYLTDLGWTSWRDIQYNFLENFDTKKVGRPIKKRLSTKKTIAKTKHPTALRRLLDNLVEFGILERKDVVELYPRSQKDKQKTHPYFRIDWRMIVSLKDFTTYESGKYWDIADKVAGGEITEQDCIKELDETRKIVQYHGVVLSNTDALERINLAWDEDKKELGRRYFNYVLNALNRESKYIQLLLLEKEFHAKANIFAYRFDPKNERIKKDLSRIKKSIPPLIKRGRDLVIDVEKIIFDEVLWETLQGSKPNPLFVQENKNFLEFLDDLAYLPKDIDNELKTIKKISSHFSSWLP